MSNDLQREILFLQSITTDEKLQLLVSAGLVVENDVVNDEDLNQIIEKNIQQLQGVPISAENNQQINEIIGETVVSTQQTPEINTPMAAIEPIQLEKIEQTIQTPAPLEKKKGKASNRLVLTIGFSGESADYVQKIIDAHKQAGLCSNNSDFGVKVFDFAINIGCFTGKQLFGVPENHQYKLIKNGFADFVNANPKITVCK